MDKDTTEITMVVLETDREDDIGVYNAKPEDVKQAIKAYYEMPEPQRDGRRGHKTLIQYLDRHFPGADHIHVKEANGGVTMDEVTLIEPQDEEE